MRAPAKTVGGQCRSARVFPQSRKVSCIKVSQPSFLGTGYEETRRGPAPSCHPSHKYINPSFCPSSSSAFLSFSFPLTSLTPAMYTPLSPRPVTRPVIAPHGRGVHITVETHTRTATPAPSVDGNDEMPALTDVTDDDAAYLTPSRAAMSAARGSELADIFDRINLDNEDEAKRREEDEAKRREAAERALRLRDRFDDEPMPDDPFPFQEKSYHVVTSGRKTGIFTSWHLVTTLVEGYSGKSHHKYNVFAVAWEHWLVSCLDGDVFGPLDDRSLVGFVKRRPPPPPPIRVPSIASVPQVKAPVRTFAAVSPVPRSVHTPRPASACVSGRDSSTSARVNATAHLSPRSSTSNRSFKAETSSSMPSLSPQSSRSSRSSSSGSSVLRPLGSTKGKRRGSGVGAYAVIYGEMPGVYNDKADALNARGPNGHYIPCSSQDSGEERMAEADALGKVRFC